MKLVPLAALPRTGSTLLMHILDQNPEFEIGPVSELSHLLSYIREFAEKVTPTSNLPKDVLHKCLIDFCREGSNSWINNLSESKNIFVDKHRYWLYQYKFIFKLFPDLKMIVPIRDLCGVVNSFEKIAHNDITVNTNQLYESLNENFYHKRIQSHLNSWYFKECLVSIKELLEIPNKYQQNIMFVRYEDLTTNPQECMKSIYDFLDLPSFNHDFDNVQQDSAYVKNYYLPYGDHKIKNEVHSPLDNEYLTSEIKLLIKSEYMWYYENFYPDLCDLSSD